ncbi:hypothetical protein COLO4_32196 [Corchorus olitorius]|uniref:Uncharacterized protein n=1 Tax=Corchorus olitorius TaxID=93759 RepID=A0A1R3H0G2_9ROSI|nr:hypothetical protein COLO4_32196 [Corchorus olitorius]
MRIVTYTEPMYIVQITFISLMADLSKTLERNNAIVLL